MKKFVSTYGILVAMLLLTVGVTFAAFTGKAKILGTSVSVGSADIKLLDDLAGGIVETNLLSEKQGPVYQNISSDWSEDYLVKIYNNSANTVTLTSNADYETVNDPEDLRQILYVQPIEWSDNNGNGVVDDAEDGVGHERKTIIKWKTEGYDFGELGAGEVKSLILRVSADSIPDTKQGASLLFDFEFDSIGL